MVLSNKKLKQKLRAAKAELIVESEARNKDAEKFRALDSKLPDSIKMIFNTESHKPTLSKREKRRQKVQENSDVVKHIELVGDMDRGKDGELKSDSMEVKMQKKRKRDEIKVKGDVENSKTEKLKKKKKSKRKPTKLGNNPGKEDDSEKNRNEASKEQLKADMDERSKRQDVEASAKVYVGGIPYYSTEDDIRSYFEGCGTIINIDCMLFPDTGKFRGIAIITFKTEAAVKRALALHGSDMGGLFLTIQPFKSSKHSKSSNFSPSVLEGYNRIYVGNLSWDITENDLRELFSDCSVTSVRLGEDKDTKEFKGYAHVDFANSLSMHIALKLDQKVVCGRPVRISCAVRRNGTLNNPTAMAKEVNNSMSIAKEIKTDGGEVGVAIEGNNEISESKTESVEVSAVSSKIRRRTCYECGERGHLSSACPKKQSMAKESNTDGHEVSIVETDDHEVSLVSEGNNNINESKTDDSEVRVVSSKIRRRTCYECGERGHLSSSCPKKQATDSTNHVAV